MNNLTLIVRCVCTQLLFSRSACEGMTLVILVTIVLKVHLLFALRFRANPEVFRCALFTSCYPRDAGN